MAAVRPSGGSVEGVSGPWGGEPDPQRATPCLDVADVERGGAQCGKARCSSHRLDLFCLIISILDEHIISFSDLKWFISDCSCCQVRNLYTRRATELVEQPCHDRAERAADARGASRASHGAALLFSNFSWNIEYTVMICWMIIIPRLSFIIINSLNINNAQFKLLE